MYLTNYVPIYSYITLRLVTLATSCLFNHTFFLVKASLKITASKNPSPKLPPKTNAALLVSKDAPFNKEIGKTALACCHFGRSPGELRERVDPMSELLCGARVGSINSQENSHS